MVCLARLVARLVASSSRCVLGARLVGAKAVLLLASPSPDAFVDKLGGLTTPKNAKQKHICRGQKTSKRGASTASCNEFTLRRGVPSNKPS